MEAQHAQGIHIRGFIKVFFFLVYLACCVKSGPVSGVKKCTIGFLLCRRMEIKSHLVASHLALKKSAYIRPFRGVVQLLSRMDACIFNCCSGVAVGPSQKSTD